MAVVALFLNVGKSIYILVVEYMMLIMDEI